MARHISILEVLDLASPDTKVTVTLAQVVDKDVKQLMLFSSKPLRQAEKELEKRIKDIQRKEAYFECLGKDLMHIIIYI